MASVFKSVGTKTVGLTATTIYTAPALTTSTCIGLSLANVLASQTVNVDVELVKGGVGYYVVKYAPISPGGALIAVGGDQKIVVEAGNYFRVTSSVASSIDTIISMLEQA